MLVQGLLQKLSLICGKSLPKDLFFRQTKTIFRYRPTDTIVTSKHEVIENEITVVGIFGDIAMTATVEKLD